MIFRFFLISVSYANAYDETLRYKGTKHIRKPRFIDLANNNRIERLHSSMRERTKVMRGFDTDPAANETMQGYRLYYNFLRPHMALDGQTPAQAANLDLQLGQNRWKSMIAQSVENGGNPSQDEEKRRSSGNALLSEWFENTRNAKRG